MRHGAPNCPLCAIERRAEMNGRAIHDVFISPQNWNALTTRGRQELALACAAHGVALMIAHGLLAPAGTIQVHGVKA